MLVCLVAVAVFLSLAMSFAWATAMSTGRSGLIDATWSFAVGAACVCVALWPIFDTDLPSRRGLVAAMAFVWSARLGVYIFRRSLGAADDPRYADLKRTWGADAPRRLFLFLQAQAIAGWPLVGAALLAAHAPFRGLGRQDWIGAATLLVGLAGETLADWQMADFRSKPTNHGRICDIGLWAWSRHPNYFFEFVCWTSYPLIAIDFGGHTPWGWIALAAPATMYWLLVHVSGAPPLEAHLARSRPQAFKDYSSRVGLFWPRWPTARR